MDIKFGKLSASASSVHQTTNNSVANFFECPPDFVLCLPRKSAQESATRLNDLDSNILENSAYLEISDEMFKIEHKIGVLEHVLGRYNDEITALESLGASIQIADLKERRRKVEEDLAELNKKYSELGLSSRIAGQLSSAFSFTAKSKHKSLSTARDFVSKNILAKISKKFGYTQRMKEALNNLQSINCSVDELINLQVPYGETDTRYEKLTAYLNKANTIHSQIAKNVDEITKKKP